MPGTMKLPGATPTPFQLGRETNQSASRNNLPSSPTRKRVVYPDGDLLPGVMGREQNGDHPSSKPHTSLISNTELGTNGVSQHGVEERRAHLASNNQGTSSGQNPNRGILLRHPNAKGMSSTVQETSLPQGVTRAWTGSPRPPITNGANTGSSVEDRLRQLINSNNKNNSTKNTNTSNGGAPVGQDNQRMQRHYNGYSGDGLFHGGGSEVFDDGEILVVPPPKSRNSQDFEVALGDHSYGPGYRHPGDHQQQRSQRNQGYVPSKPTDKRQGSRVDAILDRQSRPTPVARARQQPAAQTIPGMTAGEGTDNFAFTHDTPPTNQRNRGGLSQDNNMANKQGVSPRKVDNYDLRNACNRLYGQQNQSYGSSNQQMARGDNLRSSYGPNSQSRGFQNSGQYSVKYTPNQPQPPPPYSRPVSAPAPAHMQVHFQREEKLRGQFPSQDHLDGQGHVTVTSTSRRESPMGQSSSTQGHLEESSSSQQSAGSHGMQGFGDSGHKSQGQSDNNRVSGFTQSGPNSPNSPSYAIGPASKYPEHGSRPSSAKKPPVNYGLGSPGRKTESEMTRQLNDIPKKTDFSKPPIQRPHGNVAPSPLNQKKFVDNLSSALQNASAKGHHSRGFSFDNSHNTSYDMSHDRLMERLHEQSHDIQDQSIFDYDATQSETSGSVTPPLPPLSPTQTPPESPDNSPPLPRSFSATNVSSAEKLNDDDGGKRKTRRTSELQFRMDRKPHAKKHRPRSKFKGMGLRDVKESGTDTDSNLSFDIDDTILTVDSHDTEQPHPAGDILTSRETQLLRQQLRDLESKYQNLQSKVEKDGGTGSHAHAAASKGPGPPPIGRQRRWSIGSSDTSSFRREAKYKPGRQIIHKHHSKEFKNINKRFQRLESHVVTLARSVAHLSSELRTHNAMVNDLESVKKELRELRDNPGRPWPATLKGHMMDYSGSRGFVPSLTNPKRVNKLTKFFGAEPPLLEFFLQELGYQKYISNFKTEHIGMIELPYMTEDRLEKIGVPMGPRLRILQEARVCFQQENLDVYIV